MNAFDHVLLLLSFVYALALTHLLSRIGALYLCRERVKFFGLQTLLAVNAILSVLFNWLGLWLFRQTPSWDVFSIGNQFVNALALYFLCLVSAPEAKGEGLIDLEAFYWREYRTYYFLILASIASTIVGNLLFLRFIGLETFGIWTLAIFPFFIPVALALVTRNARAQWAAGLMLLVFELVVSSVLLGSLR